jgi:nucleoside-diphosphate-sugar epimerase
VPCWLAGAAATFAEMRQHALRDGGRPFLARELVDVVRFGRWVDTSKSVRELGLAPPTPLQTTLKKACDWYVRHRYIKGAAGAGAPTRDAEATRVP